MTRPALLLTSPVCMHKYAYSIQWMIRHYLGDVVQSKTCSGSTHHTQRRDVEEQKYSMVFRWSTKICGLLPEPWATWCHHTISFCCFAHKLCQVFLHELAHHIPSPSMAILHGWSHSYHYITNWFANMCLQHVLIKDVLKLADQFCTSFLPLFFHP